jgi:hypothetical protein
MQPAAYPPLPPPVTSAEALKPSGWWYGLAVAVAMGSIIIAIIVFVQAIGDLVDHVDEFQRVSLPGTATVTLRDTGGYTVYHEFSGASSDTVFAPTVSVNITGPDGEPVELDTYDANVSYSWGGHEGVAVYSFRADKAGDYAVSAEGERGVVAIGRGIGDGLVGGIVGSLAIGIGGAAAGGVIAIVVGVKRGRDRRSRSIYGSPYGPGPPGGGWATSGWPTATQPGWAPPPGAPGSYPPGQYPPQSPPPGGPYAPQQPPPGQYPPGPMQPPPGLPPT